MKFVKTVITAGLSFIFATMVMAKQEVSIFWPEYTGDTKAYTDSLEAAFEKAHPNIDLQIIRVNWNVLADRLTAAIAAKKEPNLTVAWGDLLLNYKKEGLLVPFDGLLKESTMANLSFTQNVDGKIYGLPQAAGSRFLYYRKDLIPTPPQTFEELKAMAQKVHNPKKKIYGWGVLGQRFAENVDFAYLLYGNGGDYFDMNGKCAANSPEGVKALTFINDAINKEKITQPGVSAYNRDGVQELFISGKLGFFLGGANIAPQLEKSEVDFEWGVAPMPYFEGKQRSSLVVFDFIIQFKRPGNHDAVGKFFDFYYQDEWRLAFDKNVGFPPVTASLGDNPAFQKPVFKAMIASNPNAKGWPLIPEWREANDILWTHFEEVFQGLDTPKDALDAACEEIDEVRNM